MARLSYKQLMDMVDKSREIYFLFRRISELQNKYPDLNQMKFICPDEKSYPINIPEITWQIFIRIIEDFVAPDDANCPYLTFPYMEKDSPFVEFTHSVITGIEFYKGKITIKLESNLMRDINANFEYHLTIYQNIVLLDNLTNIVSNQSIKNEVNAHIIKELEKFGFDLHHH